MESLSSPSQARSKSGKIMPYHYAFDQSHVPRSANLKLVCSQHRKARMKRTIIVRNDRMRFKVALLFPAV